MREQPALATVFPPVPKTVWRPGDAELECLLVGSLRAHALHVERRAGLAMRGPHIALNSGLYGIEVQLAADAAGLRANLLVATAQVTCDGGSVTLAERAITAGQLAGEMSGMYQGARLDLVLEQRTEDIELRLTSTGEAAFEVRGVKLIPRPGRVWFPADLEYEPGAWVVQADRSAIFSQPCEVSSRGITLQEGEHRLGIKLRPPAGATSGVIAGLQVSGRRFGQGSETMPPEILAADPAVTAEAMWANHNIPDAKLRFRLAEPHRDVIIRVAALVPGLTLQWVRVASADEAVWHHYYNLGGSSSALGQPTGAFVAAEPTRGSYRRFERGVIVWTIEHGPCEVYGAIGRRYAELGEMQGELGFPTGRPRIVRLPSGVEEVEQRFENGVLRERTNP